jgi:hypothetical protein
MHWGTLACNTPNGVHLRIVHTISSRDLRNLLGAVAVLNEDLDLSTLPQRSVAAVTLVVPADMVTYNDVDLIRRVDRIFTSPADPRLQADTAEYSAFIRHIDEHPLIQHNARTADPVPRKISDFLSDRRFRTTGLHSEFFRVFELNYQMALVIRHAGQQMIGIAANRKSSDFTERERTCLAVLRLHLMQAYRHGLIVARLQNGASPYGAAHSPELRIAGRLTRRELEVLQWVTPISLGSSVRPPAQ